MSFSGGGRSEVSQATPSNCSTILSATLTSSGLPFAQSGLDVLPRCTETGPSGGVQKRADRPTLTPWA